MAHFYRTMPSPIGMLTLVFDDLEQLNMILFPGNTAPASAIENCRFGDVAVTELEEYFSHRRDHFTMKMNPVGTDFQKAVWAQLLKIPYGETRSYSQIAEAVGRPTATRAVGSANGSNPLPIVVPCHRVIGANGTLTGYAGGISIKTQLLEHEGVLAGSLF
jgi:methylated-DNA-[protein]-cysteine S-methyltransferase